MDTKKYILFDYLEGNLDSNLESELVQSIATDNDFNNECKLWEKTFIPSKQIQYTQKNHLLRKPLISPLLFWFTGISSAVLIAYILLFNSTENKVNITTNVDTVLNETLPEASDDNKLTSTEVLPEEHKTNNRINGVKTHVNPVAEVKVDSVNERIEIVSLKTTKNVSEQSSINEKIEIPELKFRTTKVKKTKSKRQKRIAKKLNRKLNRPKFRDRIYNFKEALRKLRWNKEDVVEMDGF